MAEYDFSGWATKNDLRCADGRIIRHNAFEENDGTKVPLVWNHKHDGPDNVLGHALLENRADGVYAYCTFNDTERAEDAKRLVKHGDVTALSIYANQLKQRGSEVIHGAIREVSLVIAGANPGAYIENVLEHSGIDDDNSAIIFSGSESLALSHSSEDDENDNIDVNDPDEVNELDDELEHSDITAEEAENVFNAMSDEQKNVVYMLISKAIDDSTNSTAQHSEEGISEELYHADKDEETDETSDDADETVEDVFKTLTKHQQEVVYAVIAQAVEDGIKDKSAKKDDKEDSKEETEMKQNVFEADNETNSLQHGDIDVVGIIDDAKRYGSLRDSVLAHAAEYGIEDIDYLFPDAKTLNNTPEFIKREDSWVAEVLGATHHSPFSRIKSVFADITEDEARAKGYIKGKLKKDEVFTLLKRTTTPTTIYKKQRLDRDDIVDITDFDVVAWIKQEMKMMLNEEIARAILVGDGRSTSSDDKISELNIRPVWTDADLYTIHAAVSVASTATDDDKAKAFMKQAVKARKNYKGSGSPVLYTTEDMLTDMMLLEDTTGRKLYSSETELAAAIRVKKIVTVPVMENLTRDVDSVTHTLAGIIVNLSDYNVGADKGGEINMFDDFDIDYNQQKYLIETRCSGALIKPYSAIALEFVAAS